MYRNSLVRMYYSEIGKDTPQPFAEFRVFTISKEPITTNIKNIFDYKLEKLEWIFSSIMTAILKRTIFWQIEGEEINEKIDNDEALMNLLTTGLKEPMLDTVFRYARFIKENKRDMEYNEKDIRKIEEERIFQTKIDKTKISFSRYLELKHLYGFITEKQAIMYKNLDKLKF